MDLKQVFINPKGRLRSGWRLLVFSLIFLSLLILLSVTVVKGFELALPQLAPSRALAYYLENLIVRVVLLVAALLAGFICMRWLEGLPWRAMGLSLHRSWARDLLIGSAIGICSLALAAAIVTAGGGLSFTASDASLFQVCQTLLFSGVLFIIAALAEEALFRGYPLQTLTRANMAWLAIFLTSVPFAAVHLRNPNVVQGFTFVNTALAGVWLAVAYLRTRSLALLTLPLTHCFVELTWDHHG
jgi:membrane protease YdiL (CAAX protease family)